MERWQLSRKEIVRYGVIQNTIEGYLKVAEATEQLHPQMEALAVGV